MTLTPSAQEIEQQRSIQWLVLSALPQVGPVRLAALRSLTPEWPQGWLAVLPAPAAQALQLWLDHPQRSPLYAHVQQALEWQQKATCRYLLHPDHEHWPSLLGEIADPPPLLWAEGDIQALHSPCVAMVGSRRPTRAGLQHAGQFSAGLSRVGWTLVSGMALGVDAAAQIAAMDAGGRSIAVLPGGIDVIYPSRHAELYRRLRDEGGLLLAQRPLAVQPRAGDFPSRNRIVTGLSCGVVVIEAAEQSGTLISARLALEQGREVMALPGALSVPQASGCLRLIRDGAALVRHVDDVQAELEHWLPLATDLSPTVGEGGESVDDLEEVSPLLRWLGATPTPLDALVDLSGWPVAQCQRELTLLEIEGRVALEAGGWVRLPS
ncbi:DNA-processing protein DprA [Halomonas cupida]|uniref:DNA-processing protein DprA n=1 Tax=Halomonas cupida TaxID=44933 RepID=UPI003A8FAB2D